MAEALKTAFNPDLIANMARHLSRVGAFDADRFTALSLAGLEALELKARSHHIADALEACLPPDFASACAQMVAALHPDETDEGWTGKDSAHGLRGWAMMPLGEYVSRRGLAHFDLAMATLRLFSPRFSAEFDVRPFLAADQPRALVHVTRWAGDANDHVRRLASEGCRPRLPWGMQLKALIADPAPILPILTTLRDDPSEYVRRSVANNLNDIAKDHPDLVARLAADWLADATPDRARLVRHACRTLIKQGHPAVLTAFGYAPVRLARAELTIAPEQARIGDDLTLDLSLAPAGRDDQPVLIDYILSYRRANGGEGPKVFKWTTAILKPGTRRAFRKVHKLRDVTTRRHYPGLHRVQAQVNGETVAEARFDLSLQASRVSDWRRNRGGATI